MKVGLMVPMNNTTMERELLAWLPAHSMCLQREYSQPVWSPVYAAAWPAGVRLE
jgi:hypothetical protein